MSAVIYEGRKLMDKERLLRRYALISRAGELGLKGDWEASIAILEPIVRETPNDSVLVCSLGQAYFNVGRTTDAIRQYLQVLERDPDYAEAYARLASAYRRISRWLASSGHPFYGFLFALIAETIDPGHVLTRKCLQQFQTDLLGMLKVERPL